MSELVEFIRGCLDADEQTARAATGGEWETHLGAMWLVLGTCGDVELPDPEGEADATHVARHDPARVLAEVNAKRAILDKYERAKVAFEQSVNPATSAAVMVLAEVVDDLAQPYAGEPGWRDEWGTQ